MKRSEVRQWLEKALEGSVFSWQAEAKQLVCHFLNIEPLDLLLSKDLLVSSKEKELLENALKERLKGVPLQHILGKQWFMGLELSVNKHVLIPRPETEILVERVIESLKSLGASSYKILDMGTGSGAIAIALAISSDDIEVTAVDISEEALHVAKGNAKKYGLDRRIKWIKSDFFSDVPMATYDFIVSNPPYIPLADESELLVEVKGHEPHEALFAGEDGLDAYRVIVPKAYEYLKHGGQLFFEAGHDQAQRISDMMRACNFEEIGTFCDLNGIERFIYGKKG